MTVQLNAEHTKGAEIKISNIITIGTDRNGNLKVSATTLVNCNFVTFFIVEIDVNSQYVKDLRFYQEKK